jgi:heme oxygenase
MRHFRNLQDLLSIDDSDIQREMTAYMYICREEYLEYADEEDLINHDFNFQLATEIDLDQIKALGQPEEEVIIDIRCGGRSRRMHRLIFVTTVIFVNIQNIQ